MDERGYFNKKLEEFLKGKVFNSPEEVKSAINEFMIKYNQTPVDELSGLSPEQMHCILTSPFSCPEVVRFNFNAIPPVNAPFIKLFLMLIQEIGKKEQGLRTTVKGNLPRELCRKLDEEYHSEEVRKALLRDEFPIMREIDFPGLHIVRVVAELAGFIKKYKKRFILTKKGKAIIKRGFTIEDYFQLFQTYSIKFNWAYADPLEDVPIIQTSFLFTLYLLKLYGGECREVSFYGDLFIKAFPLVLEMVTPFSETHRDKVVSIYSLRAIERFAVAFGFAEKKEKPIFLASSATEIIKTQFLDKFVDLAFISPSP